MAFPTISKYSASPAKGVPGQLTGLMQHECLSKKASADIDYGKPLFGSVGDAFAVANAEEGKVFLGVAGFEERYKGYYAAGDSINCIASGNVYVPVASAVQANAQAAVLGGDFVAIGTEASSTYDPAKQTITATGTTKWVANYRYKLNTLKYSSKVPAIAAVTLKAAEDEVLTFGSEYNIEFVNGDGWYIVILGATTTTPTLYNIEITFTASTAKAMAVPVNARYLESASATGLVEIAIG